MKSLVPQENLQARLLVGWAEKNFRRDLCFNLLKPILQENLIWSFGQPLYCPV